jgi:acyl-CoA thioesterase-2
VVSDEAELWSRAEDLASILDLERLDRDLFRGVNSVRSRARFSLYGGQVAAQALRAAGLTVPEGRHAHSLHGYFLRPGRADRPVLLHVDRDRDGKTFSARHVRAVQEGEVIFSMLASFHEDEASGAFDAVPTKAEPPPDDVGDARDDGIIEVREVTALSLDGDRVLFPDTMWLRVKHPLPDDRLLRACAMVYVSDMGSGFGQVRAEGLSSGGPSIDHNVWLNADLRVDDWMLLEVYPSKAAGARGVYTGGLRDRAGTLGLFVAQEQLLRPHSPERLGVIKHMIERDSRP